MVWQWLVQLAIAAVLQVAATLLTPRPKGPKPDSVEQAESPTAEAGRPIPKLWGTGRISETNVLGFWDKSTHQYQIKV